MSLKNQILKFIGTISPVFLTRILYRRTFGKSLNLRTPQSLNEKIHWLKFYGNTTQWSLLADKYRVREYVKDKGLEQTLVKLYGVWTDANDIDWSKLPDKFVLKANNGCGDVTICKDKTMLDKQQIITYYNNLLKEDFGVQLGELHYKKIKPCIIAEELLDADKQQSPSSSLIDYKIWCFNGVPYYIFVVLNRRKGYAQYMLYDTEWNPHPEYVVSTSHFEAYDGLIGRPSNLKEMLTIASTLSKGNPQMRIDLYEVDNKIYFGELTLTSACGFMDYFTEDFLNKLGSLVVLPKDKFDVNRIKHSQEK